MNQEYHPDLLKQYGSVDELKEDIKWGNRYLMFWDDFKDSAEILPQYSEEARQQIQKHLGYIPEQVIILPHEPFLRTLIHSYKSGSISEKEFNDSVCAQVMHIRNDDMNKGGWTKDLPYTEYGLNVYNTYLLQYKDAAKKRIASFMGYEPPLEHSITAEIMIRELHTHDNFNEGMPWTPWDYKAMTVLVYTIAMLTINQEAANEMPLLAF